ncbi:hypothetical protein V6N11_048903 [Hibiscus sabdariffa]|uniref:BZIP domain-containing protein n=1 Tax=Hibiscus sabdariffa TaxID=183260 RepID=A0ABR2PXB5_9ROSI
MDPLYNLPELGDSGAISWQERAPSPGIPISFTQENLILRPPSPVFFSDYFDGVDEMLYPQTQGHADGSVQPNDVLAFSDNSIPVMPSPGLPQQGDVLPMQSHVWPVSTSFLSQENTISPPLLPSSLAFFDNLSPLVELQPVQDSFPGSRQERNTISPSSLALFDSLPPIVELPQVQGPDDDFNQMLGSQNQGYADGSMQKNYIQSCPHFENRYKYSLASLSHPHVSFHQANGAVYPLVFSENSIQATSTSSLLRGAEQHPMQNYGCSGHSNFNQLQVKSSNSQNPPLSRHQRYRQRLKAKEQTKDDDIEILKQQILKMNVELDNLRTENEMLKKELKSTEYNVTPNKKRTWIFSTSGESFLIHQFLHLHLHRRALALDPQQLFFHPLYPHLLGVDFSFRHAPTRGFKSGCVRTPRPIEASAPIDMSVEFGLLGEQHLNHGSNR